jgi:hypothetical protein
VDSRPDGSGPDHASALEAAQLQAARLEAARLDWDAMSQRLEETRARVQATLDRVRNGRSQREMLHDSAFARLCQGDVDARNNVVKKICLGRKLLGSPRHLVDQL